MSGHDDDAAPGPEKGKRPGSPRRGSDHGRAPDRPSEPPGKRGRESGQDRPRGLEPIADLLPRAAREFGLEDQLEQARAAAAWLRVVAERVPAAAGACRLISLDRGVATIQVDMPIVAQEIRLRSPELLAALRAGVGTPVVGLQLTVRHV